MENVKINTEYIKLDQFLKWVGEAGSGSEAKLLIEQGKVKINGEFDDRRGRKIRPGDIVTVNAKEYQVCI